MKKFLALLLALVMALALVGCGASAPKTEAFMDMTTSDGASEISVVINRISSV